MTDHRGSRSTGFERGLKRPQMMFAKGMVRPSIVAACSAVGE